MRIIGGKRICLDEKTVIQTVRELNGENYEIVGTEWLFEAGRT